MFITGNETWTMKNERGKKNTGGSSNQGNCIEDSGVGESKRAKAANEAA